MESGTPGAGSWIDLKHGSFREESVAVRASDVSEVISLRVVYYVVL